MDGAAWALHDAGLLRGWEELTDLPARVAEGLERMGGLVQLSMHEEARLDAMLEAETARLRDPDAALEYEHGWWGQEPLAAGDRLQLAQWRDGPGREAVVLWPGADGGCAAGAMVALEWAGAEGSAEWVSARELAGAGVNRASWNDERLRDAALARAEASVSPDLPLDCRTGLVVGDRVRWTEIVEPRGIAGEATLAGMGRSMAVTVEAEVVGRKPGPAAGRGPLHAARDLALGRRGAGPDGHLVRPADGGRGDARGRRRREEARARAARAGGEAAAGGGASAATVHGNEHEPALGAGSGP